MQVDYNNGGYQVILIDDCDFQVFHELVKDAEIELGIVISDKVDDFDSLFYTFKYCNADFILSYHVYFGIMLKLVDKMKVVENGEDLIRHIADKFIDILH